MTTNQMEEYLRPTPTIDCDRKSIRKKSRTLTKGRHNSADKGKSLFYFVRDEIKYTFYVPSDLPAHFRASQIMETGEGFCVQKAVLLTALARAADIPARLHLADIRNHLLADKPRQMIGTTLVTYHGYCELYIQGKWVKATPAFDLKMCQRNRIIPVEFDGKTDAIFHRHNLDGKLHIEYVKDHGCYEDVPLDEIYDGWVRDYGWGSRAQFNHLIETEKAKQKAQRA